MISARSLSTFRPRISSATSSPIAVRSKNLSSCRFSLPQDRLATFDLPSKSESEPNATGLCRTPSSSKIGPRTEKKLTVEAS
ncbi:hypothetical protein EYC80_008570 [Monilinia laxa]|uniref:Uncharacterized protein n=1 Tax=Monilinia laxa TaxID=61186 RepID=A0A5N6K0T6_MONLA|nr:hypothetical protein EYC80_008570 [Monilinia laxa]